MYEIFHISFFSYVVPCFYKVIIRFGEREKSVAEGGSPDMVTHGDVGVGVCWPSPVGVRAC